MVRWYVRCGDLQSAIWEYKATCKTYKENELIDVLKMNFGKYNQDKIYSAAVYYTDDDNENDTHDKDYEENLEKRFNSPFYPLIMTVTATAQEGMDFHKYADKIMHWTPAINANAFQQREGRIDRMGSLTLRRRFFELCHEKYEKQYGKKNPEEFFTMMNSSDITLREFMFHCIEDAETKEKTQAAMDAELFPMWYIPQISENSATMERISVSSYFSKEYDIFHRLIEASKKYPNFATEEPKNICASLMV